MAAVCARVSIKKKAKEMYSHQHTGTGTDGAVDESEPRVSGLPSA